MKHFRLFLAIAALTAFAACGRQGTAPQADAADPAAIQTGDLIFVALPLQFDAAPGAPTLHIQSDTEEVLYAHVAIADVAGDSIYVIDATLAHGVDRHPIDTLFATFTLADGSQPRYDIYRLSDNSRAQQYVARAMQFVGRRYDVSLDTGNSDQYCSELVANSYVSGADTLFPFRAIDLRASNGAIPRYWEFLCGLIGIPVPQGKLGIMPSDLSRDPGLTCVCLGWQPPHR